MNVDRFVTDDVIALFADTLANFWLDGNEGEGLEVDAEVALRAVLPVILARHRADVRAEFAQELAEVVPGLFYAPPPGDDEGTSEASRLLDEWAS